MASAATPNRITHYLSPYDIPCKSPGLRPPVSVYDSMITVKVVETIEGEAGEPNSTVTKEFLVYRGLLCFHSRFFNNVLNGPFREGGSVIYTITDCSIRTFTLFFNWMNTGVVSLGITAEDTLTEIDAVRLYVFADFYNIPALKNGALEFYLMTAVKNSEFDFEAVHAMYECTSENSPLRELVLDVLMNIWKFEMGELKRACKDSAQLGTDILERYLSTQVASGTNEWNGFYGPIDWQRDLMQHFCEQHHNHTDD